jgi:hypothetical protein
VNQYDAYANQPAFGPRRCCRIPLSMTAGNVPRSTCLSSTNLFATPGISIRSKRSPIQLSHLRSGLPLVSPPAPTRNRCRSRLNSLSSLNSHISTGKQGVNIPLRKQPTRNRCGGRLSMLSLLSSHISTGKRGVNVPLRKQPTRNRCGGRLSMLSLLSSHISTRELEVNVPLREQPMRN